MYDIRRKLNKLLQSTPNSSATHVMYAYCYYDTELGCIENFESDSDFGLGLEMIKVINDQDITNAHQEIWSKFPTYTKQKVWNQRYAKLH